MYLCSDQIIFNAGFRYVFLGFSSLDQIVSNFIFRYLFLDLLSLDQIIVDLILMSDGAMRQDLLNVSSPPDHVRCSMLRPISIIPFDGMQMQKKHENQCGRKLNNDFNIV
jgi:hypothetical protein